MGASSECASGGLWKSDKTLYKTNDIKECFGLKREGGDDGNPGLARFFGRVIPKKVKR